MRRSYRVLGIVGLFVLGLVLTACSASDSDEGGSRPSPVPPTASSTQAPAQNAAGTYQTLTIDEFADIVENRADEYQIINVHIPYAGDVPNTDANIPYNDVDALLHAIPDKNTPVILYCRSGNMSQQASEALAQQGYTQVWDVPGGMAAWQDSGRELVDK